MDDNNPIEVDLPAKQALIATTGIDPDYPSIDLSVKNTDGTIDLVDSPELCDGKIRLISLPAKRQVYGVQDPTITEAELQSMNWLKTWLNKDKSEKILDIVTSIVVFCPMFIILGMTFFPAYFDILLVLLMPFIVLLVGISALDTPEFYTSLYDEE